MGQFCGIKVTFMYGVSTIGIDDRLDYIKPYLWWGRKYTLSGGGAFSAPPIFSQKMAFFGEKNDKTILLYIFDDLTEGLEPMKPPQPPKKPTF